MQISFRVVLGLLGLWFEREPEERSTIPEKSGNFPNCSPTFFHFLSIVNNALETFKFADLVRQTTNFTMCSC